MAMEESKTSISDDDVESGSGNSEYYDEDGIADLFEKVHTLHKERASMSKSSAAPHRCSHSQFVINQSLLLKFHIDGDTSVTIEVTPRTTSSEVVDQIRTHGNMASCTHCTLYRDDEEIASDANLYDLIQACPDAAIQVRFEVDDDVQSPRFEAASTPRPRHSASEADVRMDSLPTIHSNASMSPALHGDRVKLRSRKNSHRAIPHNLTLRAFHKFTIQQSDENVAGDQVLTNIENSLKQLQREQYDVLKVNHALGYHQRRMLKLTEHGIENVKLKQRFLRSAAEVVTSFHLWENITNCYLEDDKTIKISYRDYRVHKEGDRRYQSPQANVIHDSIQARLRIIREQKIQGSRSEISIKFQKKLIHQQIDGSKKFEVGDHVRLTRNRCGCIVYKGFVHFAPGDPYYGIELDDANGDHDGFVDGIRYFSTTEPLRGVIVPESHIIRKTMARAAVAKNPTKQANHHLEYPHKNGGYASNSPSPRFSAKTQKLNALIGTVSAEDIIYKELKAMLLSNDTVEGRYRNNFAAKFHKYAKDENLLQLVRDYMDAVKKKLADKHSARYLDMLHSECGDDEDMKTMMENDGNENDDNGSLESLALTAQMHELSETLNKMMESAVEQTILQCKIKEIYKRCMHETQSNIQIVSLKIDKLRSRPQAFFGIKDELQSTTNWNRAVYELQLLKDCTLPSEKLSVLVNCAHAIYLSNAKEQKEKSSAADNKYHRRSQSPNEAYFVTGDDFLPIVIYVVVQASKTQPCLTDADLTFMEGLIDPIQNRSEPGYYLAVFHAALQWIRCFHH